VKQYTLDNNGFEYFKHKTLVGNFDSKKVVEEQYLPEVERLIKERIDNVDRVFVFDWRMRKYRDTAQEGDRFNLNDLTTYLVPAMEAHIDQSPASVIKRVQLQLKDDAEYLLRGRVRIINTWRPLVQTSIQDFPLAFCDSSTVLPSELIEADHVRKHYTGCCVFLSPKEGQRWYYMSKQTKEDVVMFKIFDSDPNVSAVSTPHSSFQLPDIQKDAEPRMSIEVRALVFTYPEE